MPPISDTRNTPPWTGMDIRNLLSKSALAVGAGNPIETRLQRKQSSVVKKPISLGGGVPDTATLPVNDLLDSLTKVLRNSPTETLAYGGVLGFEGMRTVLAERYSNIDNLDLNPSNFVVNNGSAGSIDNICDAFIEPGDVILVESPTFSGSIRTMRGHLAELFPIPLGNPDAIADTVKNIKAKGKHVKMLYTIADFHNPTGSTMSQKDRESLIEICSSHQILIIEDGAYSDIFFGEGPPQSLYGLANGEGILKVGTFSKTIATGLRIGWVQARSDFIDVLSSMKFDMGSSPLLLRAISDYVGSGQMDQHLSDMRPLYEEKCDALCKSLEKHCANELIFTRPSGGFFLWAKCLHADANLLSKIAEEEGLNFPAGSNFFLDGKTADTKHIRLAFSTANLNAMREVGPKMRKSIERALNTTS